MAKAKNLKGKKFDKLKVVYRSPKKPKSRKAVWICRCDCGAITEVESHRLISGETTSCGCARSDAGKNVQKFNKDKLTKDGVFTPLLKSKVRQDNNTGVKGVALRPNGKYHARITFKKQQIHLGYFDTLEEAVKARKEAEEKYFKPYLEDRR